MAILRRNKMRSGKDWRSLYFNYVRHYNTRNKELISKYGVGMYDKKLGYWEFRNAYAGTELARQQEQKEGKRGKSLNVMRDLLNEQTYKMSYKQGKSILKAKKGLIDKEIQSELNKQNPNKEVLKELRAKKKELRLSNLRLGIVDITDVQEAAKDLNELLKLNPDYVDDSYARAEEIAQEIFGS